MTIRPKSRIMYVQKYILSVKSALAVPLRSPQTRRKHPTEGGPSESLYLIRKRKDGKGEYHE